MKIGVVVPMTGQSASTGRQIDAAIKLWMAQSGGKTGGKKVEILLRGDTGVADVTRRLVQELIVHDKVVAVAGFGLTPLALAAAAGHAKQDADGCDGRSDEQHHRGLAASSCAPASRCRRCRGHGRVGARTASRRSSAWSPTTARQRRREVFVNQFLLNGGQVLRSCAPAAQPFDFAPCCKGA